LSYTRDAQTYAKAGPPRQAVLPWLSCVRVWSKPPRPVADL